MKWYKLACLDDLWDIHKSLVIPLWGDRALRIGFRLDTWCRIGPRRYKIVATRGVVDDLAGLTGETTEQAAQGLRDIGVWIEGDKPVLVKGGKGDEAEERVE